MLDGSDAPVRMLIAAAGYGKTTLAEQWVNQEGRRHAWYTARTASADVAALALGLARSASAVIDDSEVRLREHLRAVSAAAERTSVLAEILSEDLANWPREAWLVIDDYQEFAGAVEAEAFVAELVASCPVQLVITSRQRPSWVTTRDLLYGEVLEINQTALAMNNEEAAELLADWSLPSASGLVALANGWPAVIALASVSSAEIESDLPVPESLYDFFAEEVFHALGDEVYAALSTLAVAPVIDRELAEKLLVDTADEICGVALDVGILVEREDRLELHPLARAFLEERGSAPPSREVITTCLRHYEERGDWDAAFELIVRREVPDELERLLSAALDHLLKAARLSTIEAWCDHATSVGIEAPIVALARAETALRLGNQARARAYGELAASAPALAFRALSLAGRAAHLASHEEQALELYSRAEAIASSEPERREARWNQVMCMVDIDPRRAHETLQALERDVSPASPREFVKASTCKLSLGLRFGKVDASWGATAWELIPTLGDPLTETSFESIFSNVLALASRYGDALNVAERLLETAQVYRLDFARPHGLIVAGMAHAGLRDWAAATSCLDEASSLARAGGDTFAEQFAYAIKLRALAQQGRSPAALLLPPPDLTDAIPALRGEVLGSRALTLAAAERLKDADRLARTVRADPVGVEAVVLGAATNAIVSLKSAQVGALDRVRIFARAAFESGAPDLLVVAYRAIPEILAILLRDPESSDRVRDLVRRAGDEDLLEPLGVPKSADDPREKLTPREREVYHLLCNGLTNRQIAEVLVISPATAKLHVQHIFDKLGVHSRKTLAVQATLQRHGLGDIGND